MICDVTRRSTRKPRPALLVLVLCLLGGATTGAAARTIRIGYQKYGQLIILKATGRLEPVLAKRGDTVEWHLFTAGPQMLEALDADAIDLAITGETPPVAAQANGTALVYVATEPPTPSGEAIVVPKASPLRSVADLRGKQVALNRASNVHWLLIRALQAAGVPWGAIRPVYLAPPDGRAAFASGSVDAWVIWDPFLADAEAEAGARVLRDATGLVPNRQFILATRRFADRGTDALRVVLATLAANDAWANAHRGDVGSLLAGAIGLPESAVAQAAKRLPFGARPLDDAVVADQQKIADAFYALRLIPKPVAIRDIVWHDGRAP